MSNIIVKTISIMYMCTINVSIERMPKRNGLVWLFHLRLLKLYPMKA